MDNIANQTAGSVNPGRTCASGEGGRPTKRGGVGAPIVGQVFPDVKVREKNPGESVEPLAIAASGLQPVVARSPDRATAATEGLPALTDAGDLRSAGVARSGDRATAKGDRATAKGSVEPLAIAASGRRNANPLRESPPARRSRPTAQRGTVLGDADAAEGGPRIHWNRTHWPVLSMAPGRT